MITEINAAQLQQNPSKILNQVKHSQHHFLIKQNGEPIAALVDPALLLRFQRMQERFETARRHMVEVYAEIPEAQGMDAINHAVSELRKTQES